MIQKHTLVRIVDNSGGSQARVIHAYRKGKNLAPVSVGGLVKATVKRLKKSIPKKKVKKSEVVTLLVVSTAALLRRSTGLSIKNSHNLALVLNKDQDNLLANRIVSPLLVELRKTRFAKLLTLAPKIL